MRTLLLLGELYYFYIPRVALNAWSVMLPRVSKDSGREEMPIMSNKKLVPDLDNQEIVT